MEQIESRDDVSLLQHSARCSHWCNWDTLVTMHSAYLINHSPHSPYKNLFSKREKKKKKILNSQTALQLAEKTRVYSYGFF
jgi:hypothetical protein